MSKPPQVPAVITSEFVTKAPTSAVAALPPLEALDELTKELDSIVARDGRAFKQFERLDAMRIPTSEAIEAAKATLAGLPKLAERAEAADDKCRDLFPDEDRYDEDAGFRNKIIGSRVGLIVAAYPSSKDSVGGAAFGAMLVEEFKAARPSLRALETTGPAIRRTLKFKPSIAEALGELKAQERKWSERELVDIGGTAFLLEGAIPRAEERLAQAEMEKAAREEQGRLYEEELAEKILQILEDAGLGGIAWTAIRNWFPHESFQRIDAALALLESRGLARREGRQPNGDPSGEVWLAQNSAQVS